MQHDFGLHDLLFLLRGALWTVVLSLVAFAGGGVCGLAVALCRVSRGRVTRGLATAFVRVNQGTPLLIQIFIVFFGATMAGWDISALAAAAICFSVNAAAFLGEVWAGCIEAVPEGQRQAAAALGLRPYATFARVTLPQAARIAVAPTVGFLVHVIKGTSLASLIGFVELSRAGQIVNNNTYAPLLVFGFIGLFYFAICWPLSFASARLERRLGGPRRA
ncbi:MAG TPA: amino acid ABC transporter permease [Acetobacteraceae bacterium]|jgi:polar amino acid transport system permease protein|nr:amino acid ABC transporter permease [Acetobacteraceae bacterium]